MAIGVTHVAADLDAAVYWRRQKRRSPGAPLLIDGADVGDADVQEGRGVIRVRGRLEGHGRLVLGGSASDADGDPPVRQRDYRRVTLQHRLAAEHLDIEAAGALDVPGHDEVRDRDAFPGCWKSRHVLVPSRLVIALEA